MVTTAGPDGPLADVVRISQAVGTDQSLVLHGGGSTSVKSEDLLWVKASGHDLATIDADGFAVLRRSALRGLLAGPSTDDVALLRALAEESSAPQRVPSIGSLVHDLLPGRFVLHSHADALVTLTDTVHGSELVNDRLGYDLLVLPFYVPGLALARQLAEEFTRYEVSRVRGVVLAQHGLFTWADDPDEALAGHHEVVDKAAAGVWTETGVDLMAPVTAQVRTVDPGSGGPQLNRLISRLRESAQVDPVVLTARSEEVSQFLARDDLAEISQRGPVTVDHVIRTKRTPLVGDDVAGYVAAYRQYVERYAAGRSDAVVMMDPVPRIVLDPSLDAVVATGPNRAAAQIALDVYLHTIRVITAAEQLGGYRTVTEEQAFGIEYWELEQAKLR